MEKEPVVPNEQKEMEAEALKLVLFQVPECYVYMIPPRKSAASYRDVNKWVWEGILKVISKGEECIIRPEDKNTSELYARTFLRNGEPHPVEPVIDSSRYFVLRVEENIDELIYFLIVAISNDLANPSCLLLEQFKECFVFSSVIGSQDGQHRHAFIGLGFRERTEAYDFQAALHDHMKYLDKKKTAEEMEQKFQQISSVDYSLKEGESVLQIKNKTVVKSKVSENNSSPEKKGNKKEPLICIKRPLPPPAPLSPSVTVDNSSSNLPSNLNLEGTSKQEASESMEHESKETCFSGNQSTQDKLDDDFGDFQTAV